MSELFHPTGNKRVVLMGNEAFARGALEAGVSVAAAYPGTPSSEILESLSKVGKEANVYVEWSVNEKVAAEVAAAAAFSGLRGMAVMKHNGISVTMDFLTSLALTGTRGGMVILGADDPGALSSGTETETRHYARLLEVPILEPCDFQEAKDITKWAFELSEELGSLVMLRSVTRIGHASGSVNLGALPIQRRNAEFLTDGPFLDTKTGPVICMPAPYKHAMQQQRVKKAIELFEESPFNSYSGPECPELLIITSSVCTLYSREAVSLLGLEDRVGIFKLGTTWPLPPKLVSRHLKSANKILIVEEAISFLEDHVKIISAENFSQIGGKAFYGKADGTMPPLGELNPDLVMDALCKILKLPTRLNNKEYAEKAKTLVEHNQAAPAREVTFCPGCPHRASFYAINNALKLDARKGFVCGDIGCYGLAALPTGFSVLKTLHSMGSGTGVASGFGKLKDMGMDQPILSVCGDSTFFHAAIPALVNAVHNDSDITMVILDNSGTAMTGFQPHPGLSVNTFGDTTPSVSIEKICKAIGAHVETCDPFNLDRTQEILLRLIGKVKGAKVLILKQSCSLSPEKKNNKSFDMTVDMEACRGQGCGCNRLCTRIFRCMGLVWNKTTATAQIDDVLCAGCGVCTDICPAGAIERREVVC